MKCHLFVLLGRGIFRADSMIYTFHNKVMRLQVNKRSRLHRRVQIVSNHSSCVCVSRELEIAEKCRVCWFVLRALLRCHAENVILLTGAYVGSPFIAQCNALFRDYIAFIALCREKWIMVSPVSLIHSIIAELQLIVFFCCCFLRAFFSFGAWTFISHRMYTRKK